MESLPQRRAAALAQLDVCRKAYDAAKREYADVINAFAAAKQATRTTARRAHVHTDPSVQCRACFEYGHETNDCRAGTV